MSHHLKHQLVPYKIRITLVLVDPVLIPSHTIFFHHTYFFLFHQQTRFEHTQVFQLCWPVSQRYLSPLHQLNSYSFSRPFPLLGSSSSPSQNEFTLADFQSISQFHSSAIITIIVGHLHVFLLFEGQNLLLISNYIFFLFCISHSQVLILSLVSPPSFLLNLNFRINT